MYFISDKRQNKIVSSNTLEAYFFLKYFLNIVFFLNLFKKRIFVLTLTYKTDLNMCIVVWAII